MTRLEDDVGLLIYLICVPCSVSDLDQVLDMCSVLFPICEFLRNRNVCILGNSLDQLCRPRSDAYSAEQVLLNKQQIWRVGAYLGFIIVPRSLA